MTHENIVYDRRRALLEHAARIGNVSEACRVFGVSRNSYYKRLASASEYGLSALLPKERRSPHQPNAMSPEEVLTILAEAVARPTLGAGALLRHLAERGVHRSASGVAKVLARHGLGRRAQRVAALASLTAAGDGQITDAAMAGPFGFCLFASAPGQVVSLDAFYVGRLKGVGAVWQLTAVDIATRWAVVKLVVGDKNTDATRAFVDDLRRVLARMGHRLQGVLTDNGPEFAGKAFRDHIAALGIEHHRIPPRSPNHNAVCERFHGTVLQEFYRPHFHRGRVDSIALLDRSLQTWVTDYNRHRPNRGAYMRGRTPAQARAELTRRMRNTAS